jgi:porin
MPQSTFVVKKQKMIKRLLLMILFLSIPYYIMSQERQDKREIEATALITTEADWNVINGRANMLSQLNLGLNIPLWKGATLETNILAVRNLRLERGQSQHIATDRQVFSNIQLDEQLPPTLSVWGISQQVGSHLMIFAGVRNMNVDYFTSEYGSLFTNSSDGMYPTLADNWQLANYPEAALCLHFEWHINNNMTLRHSLYNGKTSKHLGGLLRFAPQSDGIVDIAELDLKEHYRLGMLNGWQPTNGEQQKRHITSLFSTVEQPLYQKNIEIGLLFEAGCAFGDDANTSAYLGAGIIAKHLLRKNDQAGIQIHHAIYTDNSHETDIEVTYRTSLTKHLYLQPAIHFIRTSSCYESIGLLRAVFSY